MRKFKKILCALLLAVGVTVFLFPEISTWLHDRESDKVVTAFNEAAAEANGTAAEGAESGTEESPCGIITPSGALWESVQAYNQGLWENGQSDFCDAWAAEQAPGIDGLEGMFGYITIPAMDVELPLYTGASTENLSKGAAILGATSLPVGGENTNSVIAGHRGYRGIPYFREIEKLGAGDAVIITNPWATLGYRVESIDIIDPGDSDKVMIREGRDMVTLLTCHPYRSHGKYRYVVYCVRDDSVLTGNDTYSGGAGDAITASDGNVYGASQADIDTERMFRYACGAALILFFVVCMLTGRKNKQKGR
ncbi:MAG: class C sortase [Clostridiales bacterium]|nr:class C sortase [Clostridiales bacterium]